MHFTEIRWLEILFIVAGLIGLWYLHRAYKFAEATHQEAKNKTFNGLTQLMRIEADQDLRNCLYRVQKQIAIILLVISALFRPPVSFDMGIEGWSRLGSIIIFGYLQYKYIMGSIKDDRDRARKMAVAEATLSSDEKLRERLRQEVSKNASS